MNESEHAKEAANAVQYGSENVSAAKMMRERMIEIAVAAAAVSADFEPAN